jgi:hypothetical protein
MAGALVERVSGHRYYYRALTTAYAGFMDIKRELATYGKNVRENWPELISAILVGILVAWPPKARS